MNRKTRQLLLKIVAKPFNILALPAVYLAAVLLKLVRRFGFVRLPACRRVLLHVGILPVRDHYYEPFIDGRRLLRPLSDPRRLPGIDWNEEAQLALLSQFHFQDELLRLPEEEQDDGVFYLDNSNYGYGDADFLYSFVRLKKPRCIIEIGSGFSTLLVIEALKANRKENPDYRCEHICVEPYEMPWLETKPVNVVRQKVETLQPDFFARLARDDMLFIDSSHMIRPQGDVVVEYLEILPTLPPGVVVHIHDIFSPRDYPSRWVVDEIRLWNEQYLLEAFLTNNNDWEIIAALNHLYQDHITELSAKCPGLRGKRHGAPPRAFYIQRKEAMAQAPRAGDLRIERRAA